MILESSQRRSAALLFHCRGAQCAGRELLQHRLLRCAQRDVVGVVRRVDAARIQENQAQNDAHARHFPSFSNLAAPGYKVHGITGDASMFSLRGIPMRLVDSALLLAALAGCAAQPRSLSAGMTGDEVSAALGKPAATGRLASGEEYWDFSKQPFGYSIDRVTFAADGRVREVRNLLTENNFKNLQAGMTPGQVGRHRRAEPGLRAARVRRRHQVVEVPLRDLEVIKLLHVIFGPDDRLQTHYTEWDPRVYSKGGSGRDSGGK